MVKPKLKLKRLPDTQAVKVRNGRPRLLRTPKEDALMIKSDENKLRAIKLRFEEGKEYREIAQILNCSLGSAYNLVNDYWAGLIENITELQIAIKSDALSESDRILLQLRPYIFNQGVTIMARDEKGQQVEYDKFEAMLKAIDRYIKIRDQQAKIAGIVMTAKPEGEGIGERTLSDLGLAVIAKTIMENVTEKKANVREVA